MVQLKDIIMLNDTDFKIEQMKMLKTIGDAVREFAISTGFDNVSVSSQCCNEPVMTSDGKMHEGLNISFTCDIYDPDLDDDDE